MKDDPGIKDFLALVADKDMAATIEGLLSRHKSLCIREISFDIRRHPERDSGCRFGGVEFLRTLSQDYRHCLLLFDREGCGDEGRSSTEIEAILEDDLRKAGLAGKSAAIAIDPELDIWVWSDSPHVDQELGWAGRTPDLRTWLESKAHIKKGQVKPPRPKEALEDALREARKPRTSSIYQALAQSVSLSRCSDRAFNRLRLTLQGWFSP
jgi:hypothetical protein